MAMHGRWPRLSELDRALYQQVDLDPRAVLPTVPAGLLYGVEPGSAAYIEDSREICLTVAGVHAIGVGDRELRAFIDLVACAVEVERAFVLADDPDAKARLTAAVAAERLGLSDVEADTILVRLAQLLRVEPSLWVGGGGFGTADWHIDLDHHVRRYRHVKSVEEFVAAKPEMFSPTPAGTYYTRRGPTLIGGANGSVATSDDGTTGSHHIAASEVLGICVAVALALASATGGVAVMRLGASLLTALGSFIVFRALRSGQGWSRATVWVPAAVAGLGLAGVAASFLV